MMAACVAGGIALGFFAMSNAMGVDVHLPLGSTLVLWLLLGGPDDTSPLACSVGAGG